MKIPAHVRKAIERHKTLRIDLGCGANKQQGCFGIDTRELPGVDLVHDLESFPWPLPDNCARVVFMSHFWEHVKPWLTLKLMAEIHRICEPGAQLLISAPYGNEFRFVQDPTHCNPSNEATFCYWDNREGLWHVYKPPCFHLDAFNVVPVVGLRDFNAFLTCCKHPVVACPVCVAREQPQATQAKTSTAALAPPARAGAARRGRATSPARGRRGSSS